MDLLRLAALDAEDLPVLSAHLQDAIVRVCDLDFVAATRSFNLVARRFDWDSPATSPRRRLAGLHIAHVLGIRTQGIDRTKPETSLNLLALTFEAGDVPSGALQLVFAGGATLRIEVECIEGRLVDLGPVWEASSRPRHDAGDP